MCDRGDIRYRSVAPHLVGADDMSDSSMVKSADAVSLRPEPGMVRQVLAFNEQLMLVRHHFEAGWSGARHSHPHGQLVYVV